MPPQEATLLVMAGVVAWQPRRAAKPPCQRLDVYPHVTHRRHAWKEGTLSGNFNRLSRCARAMGPRRWQWELREL